MGVGWRLFVLLAVGLAASPALAQSRDDEPKDLRAFPETLPYEPGEAAPPGYVVGSQPRWVPVTMGYALLTLSYGVPLFVGAIHGFDDHSGWLAVPLVGPFQWQRGVCQDKEARGEDTAGCGDGIPMLIAANQIAGLVLLTAGYGLRKKTLVRRDLALSVGPLPGEGGALGVVGRF